MSQRMRNKHILISRQLPIQDQSQAKRTLLCSEHFLICSKGFVSSGTSTFFKFCSCLSVDFSKQVVSLLLTPEALSNRRDLELDWGLEGSSCFFGVLFASSCSTLLSSKETFRALNCCSFCAMEGDLASNIDFVVDRVGIRVRGRDILRPF